MRRYWQVMQLGQPNTAIKYSRAPICNSIRTDRVRQLFYHKEGYRSIFSSSKERTSYCQQELDKTDGRSLEL